MCFCSLFSTSILFFFFFNDTATTEIYTLSYTTLFRSLLLPAIQDALRGAGGRTIEIRAITAAQHLAASPLAADAIYKHHYLDRKSTRLNSSHGYISYAVFCLKKKTETHNINTTTEPQL